MSDKDTTIELPDPDADVIVDLSEGAGTPPPDPEVVAEAQETGATPREVPPKKSAPRVRLKEGSLLEGSGEGEGGQPSKAAEEAAAALTASLKAAEDRAKAAEATALAERARAEANQRAAEAAQAEAATARGEVAARELSILTTGIETCTQQLEALQAEQTRQYEAGEFAKASALNVQIGKATAQLDRLEESKKSLEANIGRRVDTGRVEPTVQQASAFEQYVSRFVPASQNWLRAHPECVPPEVGGNAEANARMMAGHYEALAQKLPVNSPEYFKVIESRISGTAPAADEGSSPLSSAAAPAPKPAPRAQPSAPPSREPPTAGGAPRNQRQVTLSKEQQEAARLSFPHLEPKAAYTQYALNLIELTQEGKMGRTTH